MMKPKMVVMRAESFPREEKREVEACLFGNEEEGEAANTDHEADDDEEADDEEEVGACRAALPRPTSGRRHVPIGRRFVDILIFVYRRGRRICASP
mgnify:CR=1 FL=1